MGGHISGGVYNPAVTLALVLRGEIGWMKGVGYMLVQVIGGIAGGTAGFTMRKLPDESFSCPAPMGDYTTTNAFFAEMLYTTALCYVVLSVATSKPNHGNSYFGLAIGFTVCVCTCCSVVIALVRPAAHQGPAQQVLSGAVLVGDISGAVFNPAVGSGISVAALIYDPHQSCPVWIYWVRVRCIAPRVACHSLEGGYRLRPWPVPSSRRLCTGSPTSTHSCRKWSSAPTLPSHSFATTPSR